MMKREVPLLFATDYLREQGVFIFLNLNKLQNNLNPEDRIQIPLTLKSANFDESNRKHHCFSLAEVEIF